MCLIERVLYNLPINWVFIGKNYIYYPNGVTYNVQPLLGQFCGVMLEFLLWEIRGAPRSTLSSYTVWSADKSLLRNSPQACFLSQYLCLE